MHTIRHFCCCHILTQIALGFSLSLCLITRCPKQDILFIIIYSNPTKTHLVSPCPIRLPSIFHAALFHFYRIRQIPVILYIKALNRGQELEQV